MAGKAEKNSATHFIRRAVVNDAESLIAFGKAEFSRTFGHLYTKQDLEAYLSEGYDPTLYNTWLTEEKYRIFIAFRDEQESSVVGYVLCGPCTLPLENCGFAVNYATTCREIKRLYIHPSCFGSNLSLTLLQFALEWLSSEGFAENIYLGVYSENPRAIRFYSKHGFEQIGEYGFVVGETVDREFIFHWRGSIEK